MYNEKQYFNLVHIINQMNVHRVIFFSCYFATFATHNHMKLNERDNKLTHVQ